MAKSENWILLVDGQRLPVKMAHQVNLLLVRKMQKVILQGGILMKKGNVSKVVCLVVMP